MERGLLWLPLLGLFIWLTWAGWNEYQKVEAYRVWAEGFDRAKYDVYSVLGQKGSDITWGKPTRKQPIDLETFSLQNVQDLRLRVDNETVDPSQLPDRGKTIVLEFQLSDRAVQVPFTDLSLASQWHAALQADWLKYQQI